MATQIDRLKAALAGRYRVEGQLGEGGMATVYLAHDVKHDRSVALKVLKPQLAAVLGGERFLNEIRVTANLQHPNILPLYDSGEADTFLYYVMPFVEGHSLRDRLNRDSQLPVDEAVSITATIASALDFAHRHDVIHRDVKPDNVLLQDGQPMIGDFGIALAVRAAGRTRLTSTGLSLGTPEYMSPEQATDSPVDARSDQYSLGCMLYEMLAGAPPFHASSPQGVIARHITDPLPPLTTVRSGIPKGLQQVIATATAKAPADRYATIAAFIDALNRVMIGTGATGTGFTIDGRRIAAVGVAVVALVTIGFLLLQTGPPELDRTRVMVFPLVSPPGGSDMAVGEDVATMIGHSLDGVGSLRWIDGWPHLDPAVRDNVRELTPAVARRISMSKGCGYAVTGRVISRGDSADVFLDLLDVAGDSVVARSRAAGSVDDAWRIGLLAVNGLLPAIIGGSGRRESGLLDRNPTAVAQFLVGERLFRRTQTAGALDAYMAALNADSGFALAAMRGAEAATWEHDYIGARLLVDAALRLSLDERDRSFTEGLDARLRGDADQALEKFERAVSVDPDFAAAWLAIGETFKHLAPRRTGSDSMVGLALRKVLEIDTAAVSPLFHLVEMELRYGRVNAAEPLMTRFVAANPDPNLEASLRYGAACVRGELAGPDLLDIGRVDARNLSLVASWLSVGGRQLPCAIAFWSAVMTADTATDDGAGDRMAFAVTGLHNALVASGRTNDALRLLDSARVSTDAMRRVAGGTNGLTATSPAAWDREVRLRARNLVMLDEMIGINIGTRSIEVAAEDAVEWGDGYTRAYGDDLWRRAVWETWRGDTAQARRFRDVLDSRAPTLPVRMRVLIDLLPTHDALARGDTALALERLGNARPIAPEANLHGHFAYGLGLERLIEARLLLAAGRHREAIEVASLLDQSPVSYVLYVAPSLEVRIAAADALGEARLAAEYRTRRTNMRN